MLYPIFILFAMSLWLPGSVLTFKLGWKNETPSDFLFFLYHFSNTHLYPLSWLDM
jgi:hypothetical protein